MYLNITSLGKNKSIVGVIIREWPRLEVSGLRVYWCKKNWRLTKIRQRNFNLYEKNYKLYMSETSMIDVESNDGNKILNANVKH